MMGRVLDLLNYGFKVQKFCFFFVLWEKSVIEKSYQHYLIGPKFLVTNFGVTDRNKPNYSIKFKFELELLKKKEGMHLPVTIKL